VLWIEVGSLERLGPSVWKIEDAWESRADCHQARTQVMETAKQNLTQTGGEVTLDPEKNYLSVKHKDGKHSFFRYYCLPDGVDPRPHSPEKK
jgi:hypothetical protein